MSIIIFIIILAVLILVHEFGHFIVAKRSGILVEEFGLGFPPRLWGKKIGETTYSLNAIPFGGFVKIFGENSHTKNISDSDKPRSFIHKSKWTQAFVLVAGVLMNWLLAWFLISLGFMIGLPSPVLHTGPGVVQNAHLTITEVLLNSPAERAGLQPGDTVLSVVTGNGEVNKNLTADSVRSVIQGSTGDVEITYKRGGSNQNTISVTPSYDEVQKVRLVGIAMDQIGTLKLNLKDAVVEGLKSTWFLTKGTAIGLSTFIWNAIRLKSDFSQISGPVGIATVVGQARDLGFVYLLSVTALISLNLALINLLPLPALDGGRLLFVAIEAVIKRPISPKFVQWTNNIGFALLLLLMIIVTAHDILKLI